jgi:hypothetical protein
MLVTMKDSELIDKLVIIADGNIDLVLQAIRASADGDEGAADLARVVEFIVSHRQPARETEAA